MKSLLGEIDRIPATRRFGRVAAIQGLLVEVAGIQQDVSIGSHLQIVARDGRYVQAELVKWRQIIKDAGVRVE